jgi:hypothetical protein
MWFRIIMSVKCEECISFAICVNQMGFSKDPSYSFGYVFEWSDCINRCSYLQKLTKGRTHDLEFLEVKAFFMEQKGLNPYEKNKV